MDYLEKLRARIVTTGSRLCVGLDPRAEVTGRSTGMWLENVVDTCSAYAAAFKPNVAYFEAMGVEGVELLQRIIRRVPEEIPVILDAKRGDIGETQRYYATACFDFFRADAVTLSPYMGRDTVEPFLEYEGKGIYLLAVTSNSGGWEIQGAQTERGRVFEIVVRMAGGDPRVGFVVGLTNAAPEVLAVIPDAPLLIPGLGAQGGELAMMRGQNRQAPVLFNVSRGILFPPTDSTSELQAQRYADEIARNT